MSPVMSRSIRRIAALATFCAAALMSGAGNAQIAGEAGGSVAGVSTGPATIVDDQRIDTPLRTTLLQDQRAGRRATPFGSELFAGEPPSISGTMDPNYVVRAGDRIAVTAYGLVNESQELVVDPAGNIVLPNIGPIQIAGTPASQVNAKISAAAGRVYQSNVRVYAAPTGSGHLTVFVTGRVLRPGGKAGSGGDSLVAFLQRANGIDPAQGSYRHILIRRNGRTLAEADLYAFLLNGDLPNVDLRFGDTIVVGQQGPVVSVSGDARAPYTFEFAGAAGTGAELLRFARPRPEVTHASILGTRDGRPYNAYVTRAEFAGLQLFDGDRVAFRADAPADTFTIRVEGAHTGPSIYTVRRGETLGPLLQRIPLDGLADQPMIHLERQSVAVAQKQLLEESLARLEKLIYTSSSPTEGVARARAANAEGLAQFITRARTVQPRGLVSLPQEADLAGVLLEPDDVIVIPYQSQTVVIAGEVELPQTLLWTPGMNANAFVKKAGGFTNRANRADVLVIHPDGSTQRGGDVRMGDRILVPPKLQGQGIQIFKDLTQILYQTAISALALNRFD